MNPQIWLNKNTKSLQGKTVVLTGATGGLGGRLCRYLLALNATLVTLDRNEEKALALKNQLLKEFPEAHIESMLFDLASMQSVKQACTRLSEINIDYLILNAGVYNVPLSQTETGFNNIFQVNFVSPYYLVKTLLPALRRTHGKVVAVSSIAHDYSKLDENDIDFTRKKGCNKVYGNAKRFLTFSLFELFRAETEAKLSVVHPGVTLTNMTNHYPKAINWLVKIGVKVLFPPPQKAALSLIDGVFNDCGYCEWIGPKHSDIWGYPKKKLLKTATPHERERIYAIAEDIYKKIQSDEGVHAAP